MVEYRAILADYQKKDIMKRYPKYVDAYGGLFTPIMRQNLLGINPKNPEPYKDNAKFWSNVKKSVKNGLVDIQLVCDIASSNQLKKMFEHIPDYPEQETGGVVPNEYWYIRSQNLVPAICSILQNTAGDDIKQYLWKADLARRIMIECLEFFFSNHLIRSPVHERHLRESESIINAELSFY